MRHGKDTFKIGRTASHRRCMIANMLKSLIEHGRIETTERKAKELRRHADHMVTLAKENTLSSRRRAVAELMIVYNALTSKEARAVKSGKRRPSQHRPQSDREVIWRTCAAFCDSQWRVYADHQERFPHWRQRSKRLYRISPSIVFFR